MKMCIIVNKKNFKRSNNTVDRMKQHTHTHRNFSQMINYVGSLNYSQNCHITSLFSMLTLRFILLYDFSLEFFDIFL